jgi:hypothetical protein
VWELKNLVDGLEQQIKAGNELLERKCSLFTTTRRRMVRTTRKTVPREKLFELMFRPRKLGLSLHVIWRIGIKDDR